MANNIKKHRFLLVTQKKYKDFECVFSSDLTSNKVIIKIKDVYSSFMVDQIIYTLAIDINGYEVDFDISTDYCQSSFDFTFYSLLDLKTTSGGVSFERYSNTHTFLYSYLFGIFTGLDEKYEFFHYQDTNLMFHMDFSYIVDGLDVITAFYDFKLSLNNITNSSFDFMVTRII